LCFMKIRKMVNNLIFFIVYLCITETSKMGQTCCGTKPDDIELNAQKTQGVRGERSNFDPEKSQDNAVITMQRYFKGIITRRAIKE
jgi:hypothetical protein